MESQRERNPATGGIVDVGTKIALVKSLWFLGAAASQTIKGHFIDGNGKRVGPYFSTTINQGGSGNAPLQIATNMPPEAVGAIVRFSGLTFVDINPLDSPAEDFVTNYASYPLRYDQSDGPVNLGRVNIATNTARTIATVGNYREVAVTPTLDTSAYAAGDVLFDTTAIAGAVRSNDAKGYLVKLTINEEDDQTARDITLFFFSANVSLGTFNAAPSISDANARSYIGHVLISSTDWIDLGGVKVCHKELPDLGFLVTPASGTQIVYVAATTTGSPTQTASGMKFRFWFKDEA